MLNHHGPVEGRCFMGLNFSPEDFDSIQDTIVEAMVGKSRNYATEEAIAELIRERNELLAKVASNV